MPLSKMGERDIELIRQRLVGEDEMIDPKGVAKMLVFYTGQPLTPEEATSNRLSTSKQKK